MQVELKYFSLNYNVIFINHPLIQNSINSKKNFEDNNEKLQMKGEIILRTEKRKSSLPELQPLPRCVCQTISPPTLTQVSWNTRYQTGCQDTEISPTKAD